MPQLPAKPNLTYLKTQAKALLKAYRSGDSNVYTRIYQGITGFTPSSRFLLADDQTVIAREYGFPSWPKLKQYVEAVLGSLTQDQKNRSNRKYAIKTLAEQLLSWSRNHEIENLANRLALMPLHEILDVRTFVLVKGQHSLLVDGLLERLKQP